MIINMFCSTIANQYSKDFVRFVEIPLENQNPYTKKSKHSKTLTQNKDGEIVTCSDVV